MISDLVNNVTQTIHLSERHIKKGTVELLNEGKISIHDITVESLNGSAEDFLNKYKVREYNVIITHNGKSKILIYNK